MKTITVAVHDGVFHADDVFSASVVEMMSLNQVAIFRTRIPEEIEAVDIAIDVGGVYDPLRGRFDHHFVGSPTRQNGLPYAAFGLVWKAFGADVVAQLSDEFGDLNQDELDDTIDRVDQLLVQAVDAADNGVPLVKERAWPDARLATVSSIISGFNPGWMGEGEEHDVCFEEATEVAKIILWNTVRSAVQWVKARSIVETSLQAAEEGVMVLTRPVPWQEHLFASLQEQAETVLYVVFPGSGSPAWMVQCVPPMPGSFDKRKALPESWAGLRDADIQEETAASTAVFCHPGRFICGAEDFEDAMKMAKLAVRS